MWAPPVEPGPAPTTAPAVSPELARARQLAQGAEHLAQPCIIGFLRGGEPIHARIDKAAGGSEMIADGDKTGGHAFQ